MVQMSVKQLHSESKYGIDIKDNKAVAGNLKLIDNVLTDLLGAVAAIFWEQIKYDLVNWFSDENSFESLQHNADPKFSDLISK